MNNSIQVLIDVDTFYFININFNYNLDNPFFRNIKGSSPAVLI